jgi:hypothetical protein
LQGPEALRHSPKTNVQNRFLSCCFEVKLINLKNLSVSQSGRVTPMIWMTIALSCHKKGRGVSTRGKSMSVGNRTRGSSLAAHVKAKIRKCACRQTCHTPMPIADRSCCYSLCTQVWHCNL